MTARLVPTTVVLALLCVALYAAEPPLTPRLVGNWWTVAGDPDLGPLTNPNQQPVDFSIWQAADGTWQIWSCIRGTKEPGKTRLFHRWEGAQLTDRDWTPRGVALQADPDLNETQGGLQAPYVIPHEGKYWMFYGDWANICLATSADGKAFTRYRNSESKLQLDFPGHLDRNRNTRDPMVRRIGDLWYCYYTAHPANKGFDFARTSADLLHWSAEYVVAAGGKSGEGPYSAECPFVVEPQAGDLYLFRTQRYGKEAQTLVYYSRNPLDFGIDNDAEHYVTALPVAAPEIFQHEGQWYMAALLPSLKGIQITRMEWVPRIFNFRNYSLSLPAQAHPIPQPLPPEKKPGFGIRGIKGWNWTAEQYLEEIPILAEYRMNFLMNCYLSNFETEGKWINKWWEPLSERRKKGYIEIIRKCERYHINFCFALHPQLASPRPLVPNKTEDVENCYHHYAWAQEQGVKWFSISLDDVSWGDRGPRAGGSAHARLVNTIFDRLRIKDKEAQMIFCPVPYWGDGTRKEDREYLESLAKEMHPEVYVFWTGNEVVPARMTPGAARSYKATVGHRLIIWENYPVNDASPTLHLGPITGRDPELAEIADGYMSNSLCPQNQINRIPLLTCADFAWNPAGYDPNRSIGQALLHWGKTAEQRQILKELVELYPGTMLANPSYTGYRPVYNAVLAQFTDKLESSRDEAETLVTYVRGLEQRMAKAFPNLFEDARQTMRRNITEMNDILRDIR